MKRSSLTSGDGQLHVLLPSKGNGSTDTVTLAGPSTTHRISLASTGTDEGISPAYLSPEVTHRPLYTSGKGETAASVDPHAGLWPSEIWGPLEDLLPPPAQQPPVELARPAHAVAGEPPVVPTSLLSQVLIAAKRHGTALPPLREYCEDMLHKTTIAADAHVAIRGIPLRPMLDMSGVSAQTNDPMFTEDTVEYQLRHPIPPHVLSKFPRYADFPLLLSKIENDELEPNTTEVHNVKHLRGHNEAMMDNIWMHRNDVSPAGGVRQTYMYVPNFGRVQVLLFPHPGGTAYPLVTLPKMTPADILRVLDKKKAYKELRWTHRCGVFLRQVSCGML